MNKKILPFLGALLLCGCLYSGYHKVDQTVCEMAAHPFDVSPETATPISVDPPDGKSASTGSSSAEAVLAQTAGMDLRTVSYLERADDKVEDAGETRGKNAPPAIPAAIPGSETLQIKYGKDNPTDAEKAAYVKSLYPPLPPLTEEPVALPGPHGHPYTLDDLQRLAAANSPTLREAAADVVTAKGNWVQAGAYANPTVGYQSNPSNDSSTAGARAAYFDQNISTGGKLKLAAAAAEKDFDNANLALKRARSDLATQVRNAYFALVVSKEAVRVTKALAQFTDEVYQVMVGYRAGGLGALYEPAALRAQAYSARMAYRQAIQTYIYNWEQLRAALAVRELPLTEVAGRIDAFIPYYDYTVVLNHVLGNHTDLKVAANGIEKARYNLKLAQVQVIPNVDVGLTVQKELALPPFQWFWSAQVAMPIPIWDQNRGNILAAQGSLIHAQEEPHRVEASLTNTLAGAYGNYRTNLEAVEYYRKYILPDQVRVYRGVFNRRTVDKDASFYDLVNAQQALATSVGQYLATLGSLWTSVVSVADLLQTDDLFQLGKPMAVDPIPELLHRPPLPCVHPCAEVAAPVVHALPQLPSASALPSKPVWISSHGPAVLPTVLPPAPAASAPTAVPAALPSSEAVLTPVTGTFLPPAAELAEKPGPGLAPRPAPALTPAPAAAGPDKLSTLPDLQLLAEPPPVGPSDVLPDLAPTPAPDK